MVYNARSHQGWVPEWLSNNKEKVVSMMSKGKFTKWRFGAVECLEDLLVRCDLADGGCLEWRGARSRGGYGKVGYGGTVKLVHRLAFELSSGIDPKGSMVCHRCDNPGCAEPGHLFLGTAKDNVRDMMRKGRKANTVKKLSKVEAMRIREVSRRGNTNTVKGLAAEYGISVTHVWKIRAGKVWKGLPGSGEADLFGDPL